MGVLLYLATIVRPYFAFRGTFARFRSSPTQGHWTAIKRVYRYLKGTKETNLVQSQLEFETTGLFLFLMFWSSYVQ